MASLLRETTARASISVCRSCQTATTSRTPQFRSFASSPSLFVGPESPRFIDVPESLQPEAPRKRIVKGILPVPRDLFPTRRPDKPGKDYLLAATPEPTTKRSSVPPDHPHYRYLEWKRTMAHIRRQNLRAGLRELHHREQETQRRIKAKSGFKLNQRDRILSQGQREDERLTAQSVIENMKPSNSAVLPDPDREARVDRSRANVEAKQAMEKEERVDALHTLYMNARNFIVTEEQLAEEIERVFPEGENLDWTNDEEAGENIWNLGAPPTVASLVRKGPGDDLALWTTEQKRVKKLAEELTGGAI
ncbi:hypothetical protein AJ80_00270 [Polytolypa hystricis UAMH7299]|uniref:Uncharacterized protein n=1 Tax=Polytolypa hystricis (strain UAMH7299) TaxID=1447883 RepID=A0A2B7Z333_POLH7|nr:hypothetical protein AJ80_00270 [Polytolypa hystricis UAMH7299]